MCARRPPKGRSRSWRTSRTATDLQDHTSPAALYIGAPTVPPVQCTWVICVDWKENPFASIDFTALCKNHPNNMHIANWRGCQVRRSSCIVISSDSFLHSLIVKILDSLALVWKTIFFDLSVGPDDELCVVIGRVQPDNNTYCVYDLSGLSPAFLIAIYSPLTGRGAAGGALHHLAASSACLPIWSVSELAAANVHFSRASEHQGPSLQH